MRHRFLVILVVACLPSVSGDCINSSSTFGLNFPSFSCGSVGENTTFKYIADFEVLCDGNSISPLYHEFTVGWGDDTVPDIVAKDMSNGEEIMIYHVYEQVGQYLTSYLISIHVTTGFNATFNKTSDPMEINVTADDCAVSNTIEPSNEPSNDPSINTSSAPCQVVDSFYLLSTMLLPLVMLW